MRISYLGKYIIDHILIQLNGEKLDDQIVKNIVQVLKLTGRHLEEDQDFERLNQVFQQLENLQKNCGDISSGKYFWSVLKITVLFLIIMTHVLLFKKFNKMLFLHFF